MFSSPVIVQPNTTYVASYFAPNGHYSVTSPGLRPRSTTRRCTRWPTRQRERRLRLRRRRRLPHEQLQRDQLLGRRRSSRPPAPGQVDGVRPRRARRRPTVSWTAPAGGGPVTSYTVTPYIGADGADAGDGHRLAAGDERKVDGLTGGDELHVHGAGGQPQRRGPGVGAVERGDPDGGRGAGRADRRGRPRRHRSGAGRLDAAEENGGSPITGYTVTPYVGATALAPVGVGAVTTSATSRASTNGTPTASGSRRRNAAAPARRPTARTRSPREDDLRLGDPGDRRRRRRDSGRARRQVPVGRRGHGHRDPLLQGGRQHRYPPARLWTAAGAALATATFSGETASGWQQVDSRRRWHHRRNDLRRVLLRPQRALLRDRRGLSRRRATTRRCTRSLTHQPQRRLRVSAVSTFPTSTWNATNYLVDVMFRAGS